jgi:hypothetical protein
VVTTAAGSAGGSDTDAGESTGGGTGDAEGSTEGSGDDRPPEPKFDGCSDPLPDGWVFCEDFESVEDPAAVFFEFQGDDGTFVVDQRRGASGVRSLRARYRAGQEAAGWLSIAFGESPVANAMARPQYESAGDFDEVYFRLRLRMQPGWPDAGPHKLARLTSLADPDWGEAMVAHLASNGEDVVLAAEASTCVYGAEVPCQGVDDTSGLASIGWLVGQTPVFSEDLAGDWHCVEAHVRLNAPGEPDGVYEFWVDGNLESSRVDLDWRGIWTDYAINQLTIENFWTGGAPEDLDRWIDDIVIATEPIGCE